MNTLIVTGGMGSGKSYILKIFSYLGVPIYMADEKTKELYANDEELQNSINSLFKANIFIKGHFDKDLMASLIFSNKKMLTQLEEVVHPIVCNDFVKWRDSFKENDVPFVIMESAIFLEKPILHSLSDKILTISSPIQLRYKRIRKRDNISDEKIGERLKNQWSDQQRIDKSDFVIYSDEVQPILPQVLKVYNYMKNGKF